MKDMVPKSDLFIPEDRRVSLCGWDFTLRITESPFHPVKSIVVGSYHKLENPESPELIYSYSFQNVPEFERIPARYLNDLIREQCAWLMSHWWEHKLKVCPCIDGRGEEENNFRREFMRSVLMFDPPLSFGATMRMEYVIKGIQ